MTIRRKYCNALYATCYIYKYLSATAWIKELIFFLDILLKFQIIIFTINFIEFCIKTFKLTLKLEFHYNSPITYIKSNYIGY